MKKFLNTFLFYIAAIIVIGQNTFNPTSLNECKARSAPEWLMSGIIYQIQPRAFTQEGTLKAATVRLQKIAELGATIIYLCPVFVADDDTDQTFWSQKQKASGMNNAKNPYRIMDYYHVDPEYGSDDDLKEFIVESHRLGLRVILDIVYLHCGPKAVFLKDHPDFVKRDKDGRVINSPWNFPALNFENPALREYLWENMEYWVTGFNVDGFRCDVSDRVSLDFWETTRERLEVIRPDIVMLAEGERNEDQIKAFDLNYSFTWFNTLRAVYDGKMTVADLRKTWEEMAKARPLGTRFIRYTDNHDIANNAWHNRIERAWGFAGVNVALLLNFTLDGVPFLYNGQEVADTARHSIFGRLPIDWMNNNTPVGRDRFSFCQKLCDLRHEEYSLTHGSLEWIESDSPDVLSFFRKFKGEQILIVVNLTRQQVDVRLKGIGEVKGELFEILLSEGTKGDIHNGFKISAYGYWIGKIHGKD